MSDNEGVVEVDDLLSQPGTYFNPQTEVVVVVDDSTSIDQEVFNMEAYEGADWVRISEEVPIDEDDRDRLLEGFQAVAHPASATKLSDLELDESEDDGPDDEFINSLVQGSAVISPGNTIWMIVDLEPGTYAVICTFPSDDGRVHAMDGMLKVVTVA